jgi:Yip1-like protein
MSIDTPGQGSRDIVSRVKGILLTPKTEWPVIAAETTTVADLYKSYAIILAAIPAIATFIGMSIIGVGFFRMPIGTGLTMAVAMYIMALVGVFVIALIIDALAPTFGSTKDQMQALKTAVYSMTAYWVASIFTIIPGLGSLIALVGGLYGLYLLYLGLPFTMKTPQDKAVAYTAVTVVCSVVVMIVLNFVILSVVGVGTVASGALGSFGGPTSSSSVTFDPGSPLGALQQYAEKLEGATKNLESAQNSGDADAQAKAFGNMLGAVLGGSGGESLPPDQLRGIVPASLGGLARNEISVERNAALGIQISQAEATYSDGAGKELDLEIMDLGGSAGLMAVAAWAGIEQDRQSSTGYEKTYRANNRVLHEVWDQSSKHGEFSVITSNRFVVTIRGNVPSMDALKSVAGGVDLAALDRMGAAQASAR